jgi:thioredoxin 1
MLSPILEEIASEKTNIKFGKLDIDTAQSVAMKLQIQSVPTVFIFKDNKPIDHIVGFLPKELIIKFIDSNS